MYGVGVGLGVSVALLYRSHTALNRECRAVSWIFILFIIKMGGDIKGTISRPFFWRLYCTVVYCFFKFDGDTRLDVFVYT